MTSTTSNTAPRALVLQIGTQKFPVLRTTKTAKPGEPQDTSVYFTLRFANETSGYHGIPVDPASFKDPLALDELPTGVVLDGIKVYLDKGLTSDKKYSRVVTGVVNGKPVYDTLVEEIPVEKRREVAASNTYQYVPSLKGTDGPEDTGLRHVQVSVSVTEDNLWQVKVVVNRKGLGASPAAVKAGRLARAQSSLDDFAAILEAMGVEDIREDSDEESDEDE